MKCPKCQANAPKDQNFCGGCGYPLQLVCSGCGAASPLSFRFCGQCGKNLADVGNMMLDRAGIVIDADQTALAILSKSLDDVKGRPFSFFVSLDDMVIFFSHWNELVSTRQRRNMEIELKSDQPDGRFAQIELSVPQKETNGRYHLGIADITDHRHAQDQIQDKNDLINLIFSITNDLAQIDDAHRKLTICEILERISLFVGAQCGFVSRINRPSYQMETFCRWHHPDWQNNIAVRSVGVQMKTALGSLRHILARLQKERAWVISDLQHSSEAEQKEILAWQGIRSGKMLLHTIDIQNQPVGLLGLIAADKQPWSQETILFIKLVSRLVADVVHPRAVAATRNRPPTPKPPPANYGADLAYGRKEDDDLGYADLGDSIPSDDGSSQPNPAKKDAQPAMTFETDNGNPGIDRQRVTAGENGRFRITCPACRQVERISPDVFAELGFALKVGCGCGERFSIMREQRRSYRKKVQLEGFFSRIGPNGKKPAAGAVWGPMLVKDISKEGLGFTSVKANMLQIGNSVLVQFHLDNDTQTLIKKNALVKTVVGDTVGCQFIGSDRYDVSLGFYFL